MTDDAHNIRLALKNLRANLHEIKREMNLLVKSEMDKYDRLIRDSNDAQHTMAHRGGRLKDSKSDTEVVAGVRKLTAFGSDITQWAMEINFHPLNN